MEILTTHRCFGGTLGYYRHSSQATQCDMRFTAFIPPQPGPRPALFFLSGLSCTEDNFTVKSGVYRFAAALGLAVVACDTSPRGEGVPTDAAQGIGFGAGFYVDATQEPWSRHYRMETYITQELRALVLAHFPVDAGRLGIFGHSMGGHGALSLFFRHPDLYRSVSAFAPVCSVMHSPLGQKALAVYLGADRNLWEPYDAVLLAERQPTRRTTILIDQGMDDPFLHTSLHPALFKAACEKSGQKLDLRMQEGYDHGYFFIQTFIEDHLRHHAAILQ